MIIIINTNTGAFIQLQPPLSIIEKANIKNALLNGYLVACTTDDDREYLKPMLDEMAKEGYQVAVDKMDDVIKGNNPGQHFYSPTSEYEGTWEDPYKSKPPFPPDTINEDVVVKIGILYNPRAYGLI